MLHDRTAVVAQHPAATVFRSPKTAVTVRYIFPQHAHLKARRRIATRCAGGTRIDQECGELLLGAHAAHGKHDVSFRKIP
jgi:hypothetical protein